MKFNQVALLLVLVASVFGIAPCTAAEPSPGDGAQNAAAQRPNEFWRKRADGWFWYREPAPVPEAEPARAAPKPAPQSSWARDLRAVELFRKNLEDARKVAVFNPSQENVRRYLRFEQAAYEQSVAFGNVFQQMGQRDPEFSAAVRGLRPTNALGAQIYDASKRNEEQTTVRALAQRYGLFFFFRSDCPFCHQFAPTLRGFADRYGYSVVPISMDGAGLPDYPQPRLNSDLAKRLGVEMVPAVVAVDPSESRYQVIAFGLVSASDLEERIAQLAQVNNRPELPVSQRDAMGRGSVTTASSEDIARNGANNGK